MFNWAYGFQKVSVHDVWVKVWELRQLTEHQGTSETPESASHRHTWCFPNSSTNWEPNIQIYPLGGATCIQILTSWESLLPPNASNQSFNTGPFEYYFQLKPWCYPSSVLCCLSLLLLIPLRMLCLCPHTCSERSEHKAGKSQCHWISMLVLWKELPVEDREHCSHDIVGSWEEDKWLLRPVSGHALVSC